MKYENFKTLDELYENISRGGEIEFMYQNKMYSITHSKNNIIVMEAYNPSTEKVYENPEEVGDYRIGEVQIKNILDKMTITFRCF